MLDFIGSHYLWFKALHVIAVIAWMAGLLYLPRLFVYHTSAPSGGELDGTLQTMERRLYRFIMNPAMMAAWLFGGLMAAALPDLFKQGWMHGKLLCVVLMTGVHVYLSMQMRAFAAGKRPHGDRFYRLVNEIPTVLMVIIVILAVAEPF